MYHIDPASALEHLEDDGGAPKVRLNKVNQLRQEASTYTV
jgi:hypothetical protein